MLPKDVEELIHEYLLQLRVSKVNAQIAEKYAEYKVVIMQYIEDMKEEKCPTIVRYINWEKKTQKFLNRFPHYILPTRYRF